MLKITRTDRGDLTRTLKLEGKLVEPWVGELRHACGTPRESSARVRLDLVDLTFVDEAGARLLESLIRDGARVVTCSGFVAELLHLETP